MNVCMKMAFAAALCVAATGSADAVTGSSNEFRLDCRTGERESSGTEALSFSSLWDGGDGASVTIAQDGATIFDGLTGEGVKTWTVDRDGRYTLTHTTYRGGVAVNVESAVFVVEGVTPVPYLDWDDVNREMTNAVCTSYKIVTPKTAAFGAGTTYVVQGRVELYNGVVEGTEASPTRLILCDGAELSFEYNLDVSNLGATTNALFIYGQIGGTGRLEAFGGADEAAIGGGHGYAGGVVTINGGTVVANATDKSYGAGIGGGDGGHGGVVTINGGTVVAIGGDDCAGIGGGLGGDGGTVTINGGVVTAIGGGHGAGIGTCGGYVDFYDYDYDPSRNAVTINGGVVTAIGGVNAAGIGGGTEGSAYGDDGKGAKVTINGGEVTAKSGGSSVAAIGAGLRNDDAGTVSFGEGVNFLVSAGESEPGVAVDQSAYAASHGAAYVHIKEVNVNTSTTPVPVPYEWLDKYGLGGTEAAYEAAAKAPAANGVNAVWECYVAGLDPTDMAAVFRALIAFENGTLVVSWEPKLPPEEEAKRIYTVNGKAKLTDGWSDPADMEKHRFFRVDVKMK